MKLRFDEILCSNFGNANYVVDHIKRSRGPQVPHPWSRVTSFNILLKGVMLVVTKIIYCNTHTQQSILRKLAGLKNSVCGPTVARGPAVGPRCYRRMIAKDWSEWRWAFSVHGVDNWLLLRIMCGTKRLNLFFQLHEASETLNTYVMGVWSDNFTAAFFVGFNVTVFVADIEGIQSKLICSWVGTTTCSVNVTSTCSVNLHDIRERERELIGAKIKQKNISRRKPSRKPPI